MKYLKFLAFIVGLEVALLFFTYTYNYNPDVYTFHLPSDTLQLKFPKPFFITEKKKQEDKSAEIFKMLDSLPELTIVKPPEAPKVSINYHFSVDSSLRIINPYNENTGIYALDPFFENLYKLQAGENEHLHIAFYGDSQIEGDRITRLFRSYLQKVFGGNGLGFVPIITPATNFSILKQEIFGHWIHKSIFLKKRRHGNCYGPSGNMYYFINDNDTLPAIKFKLRNFIFYDSLSLLLGNVPDKLVINIYSGTDSLILKDSILPAEQKLLKYSLSLPEAIKRDFKMEFIANKSPEFYGLEFDVNKGVQVDNYGIRGHGGQGWKFADANCTAFFLKNLNTKLIILEYGGNAVPYESENYQWFGYELQKVITFFKKALPGVPILVIGVGDMAKATPESVESYESIEKIRTIQKQVALKNGCAFWDLYNAMGGKNSIVEWVKQGLAAKDYAHFSYYGQKLVAKVLYQALMFEYQEFLKRKQLP